MPRTYKDRKQYIIDAVTLYRQRVKARAIAYKGGKCINCGYNKSVRALNFHHLDASTKSFSISMQGMCKAWATVKAELDKCVLLCSNCHMEVHEGTTILPGVVVARDPVKI